MDAPSSTSRLPETRSTSAVPDARQLDFLRGLWPRTASAPTPTPKGGRGAAAAIDELSLPPGPLTVRYVRHPRARRYRLLFQRDGAARCTVPPRGTLAEARKFVASQEAWLSARLQQHLTRPSGPEALRPGGAVWLYGAETAVQATPAAAEGLLDIQLSDLRFQIPAAEDDLRPAIETALRRIAAERLKSRAAELAALHGLAAKVRRISVRNQRTRWGSCSPRGRICLNWRLIQLPPSVCDYVILHELAHLRRLDHSAQFWAEVERLCPAYAEAEAWLKRSGRQVL